MKQGNYKNKKYRNCKNRFRNYIKKIKYKNNKIKSRINYYFNTNNRLVNKSRIMSIKLKLMNLVQKI